MHTPMGYICQGLLLSQGHPFFATRNTDADDVINSTAGDQVIGSNLEEAEEDKDFEDEWDPISQAKFCCKTLSIRICLHNTAFER